MPLTAEEQFNVEVLKLLLQLAWSDGELRAEEGQLIVGIGRSWLVPEAELAALQDHLARKQKLPAPNLGILRSRPDDVLDAARALTRTDGHVGLEEEEMLEQIQQMLGTG